MASNESSAVIAVLVKELDAVRAIAISATMEVQALRARIEELETRLQEPKDGDTAGS